MQGQREHLGILEEGREIGHFSCFMVKETVSHVIPCHVFQKEVFVVFKSHDQLPAFPSHFEVATPVISPTLSYSNSPGRREDCLHRGLQ